MVDRPMGGSGLRCQCRVPGLGAGVREFGQCHRQDGRNIRLGNTDVAKMGLFAGIGEWETGLSDDGKTED
jgi:hypothetical protein